MPAHRSRPLLLLFALLALIPCLVVCAGGAPTPSGEKAPPPRPPAVKNQKLDEVDQLVKDQKLEEASKKLDATIADARRRGDDDLIAFALVRRTQLRIALGGYETAVRELKAAAWPKSPVPAIALELYYAHALTSYVQQYSWEIGQREKVDSKGAVDLKSFTKDQIAAEAMKSYASLWKRRDAVADWSVGLLGPYLDPNTYPSNIRGTLRDAISYLAVAQLADSSLWRPEQSNELFRVDFAALLKGGGGAVALDGDAHPMVKIGSVLDDLEAFHARAGRPEAALEARLERLRRLYGAYTDARERDRLAGALAERLAKERQRPWWAMGQALAAEWMQNKGELVRAHELADEGRRAYPRSTGGKICDEIAAHIEAPDYQLGAMSNDAVGKRSLLVTARNLPRLYLRAYPIDAHARLGRSHDYNLLLLGNDELQKLLSGKAAVEWSVELPATPDYASHRTFVTPPIKQKGAYAIIASTTPDFGEAKNRRMAVQMTLSDLVFTSRSTPGGKLEVTVYDGPSGKLQEGAVVELWELDWRKGHHQIDEKLSDKSGSASFSSSTNRSVFLVARRGEDLTFDPQAQYLSSRYTERERTRSLVYTDRSVYRPGQKVLWKAVAYEGSSQDGRYKVVPGRSFTVSLRDANHQVVQKLDVKGSAFGSAAGEFTIPAAGRLLGAWQIVTSINGQQSIRVEEYKRPTFEVTLKEPPTPLRLNQPARLLGEARYYFGLPVTAGAARYTVTREPVYPYWWGWYGGGARTSGAQTIARGSAPLLADGSFEVKFLPEASAKTDPHVSYRYAISADVTDEGGETRSASRSYRLALSTVEATIGSELGFLDTGKSGTVTIHRSDLDGNPRAGKGRWRLVNIEQPDKTLLPAELPPAGVSDVDDEGESGATKKLLTPGDKLRARFETSYDATRVLGAWKDGAVLGQGEISADDKGLAVLKLPALPAGAYRVRYETADEHGMKAEAWKELVVAGEGTLHLPALLAIAQSQVRVGDKVRLLVGSGLSDQLLLLDTFRAGELVDRKQLSGKATVIELPMKEADRGGLAFVLSVVRDHQIITLTQMVTVPWDNQALKVSFATFRDQLRPGGKETFRVTVEGGDKNGARLAAGAAELLAYMYDRSLDLFAPHSPPSPLGLFPWRAQATQARATLSAAQARYLGQDHLRDIPSAPRPEGDRYRVENSWGLGGMGVRGYGRGGGGIGLGYGRMALRLESPAPSGAAAPMKEQLEGRVTTAETGKNVQQKALAADDRERDDDASGKDEAKKRAGSAPAAEPVRSNFAETAFWQPSLLTNGKGEASFEFTVPDSVTSWRVWVHALTKDMRSGSAMKETRSVKDLMVRPYLPRFLREGDEAVLKVVVNNAGSTKLDGTLAFDIVDPETQESRMSLFGGKAESRAISVPPGKSTSLSFPVKAPRAVGSYAILARATAKSGADSFSDGELRPVPVLPSRLHLMQSRFVTLRDADQREMKFDDLLKNDDPSRSNEKLVVTLDAQLFYTVLRALPYLIDYPYECSEQTLNRFVSTGIVTSLFEQYPSVKKMADTMSRRSTQLQSWDAGDANRKLALEEAPFLYEARGGANQDGDVSLVNVLDSRIARANRDGALDKLKKMQTSIGGFPWFPGGPPSPYMTLYVLYGFAKAAEFKVEVPKDIVQRGWQYVARHFREEYVGKLAKEQADVHFLTFLNYVASSYPDESWTGGALSMDERKQILEYSLQHWRDHSPYIKGLLALTLKRMGRSSDGKKVFDSVMDSAKTQKDQGTFWAPEDRSWLWYNDTIESHAFALRVLMELDPQNAKKDGLVLWLLLNKKLNQWKSTRATAEVIYSLAKYMQADQSLGVREAATVSIGARQQTYTFEPDRYVGKVQLIVPGPEVDAKSALVRVEKKTKGVMFASATWQFATDKLPTEERGDFFAVSRKYFLRENNGREFVLKPLAEGQTLKPGDEIEVQLAISAKHEAEYVHLRDPRGAGFEPTALASRYKYDLGLGYYEEVRDSGANFFFEHLPVGQYTFKYRVRATTGGTFRVGPAELQSMYAPEFAAYSTGQILKIAGP